MDSTKRMYFRTGTDRKPIGLALQGGGSWGAYTWGALDSLLASRSLAIAQLSGTSAGAINAAIIAGELAKGSPARARKALRSFWLSIADPVGSLSSPLERQWRNSMNDWLLTSGLMSLYKPAALGVHPLRDAIAAHVDIDAIRSPSAPALFITVTNVRTGLPRVISNHEMSLEALLASTCLPDLFPAVELDGEYYWDGGYSGNPTLWPMVRSRLADDLIIVQLAPDRIEQVPTDPPSIRRRVGEIAFHSSLVAEVQAIHAMRVVAEASKAASLAKLRFHRIGPPRPELFEQGNGLARARPWLQLLHAEGLAAGRQFMARHGADIGIRETLDVPGTFLDAHQPKIRMPANEPFHYSDAAAMPEAA
jgi:NTE family protein